MRWSLLVTAAWVVGCTRPNPAFDEFASGSEASESGDASESSDASESGTEATTQGESESESESGVADLPPPACEFQPSAGLDLKYGDVDYFGGTCPGSVDIWARVLESGGGMVTVETCAPGCKACGGAHPLSIFPLSVTDHLPADPAMACLKLQASVSLGASPDVCQWGALSLYDGLSAAPYVIAITHGAEPTPMGAASLGDSIPEPVEVGVCTCDDVGQGHDCCYQAPTPPTFWAYPWGGEYLLPGDSAEITLANQAGLLHYFKVLQAERLNICDSPERALSWAVVAAQP